MKTMDRNKSEQLFNQLFELEFKLQNLRCTVQNPDFVNEDNAAENYKIFKQSYLMIMNELTLIGKDIYILHKELDPSI